MWEERSLTIKQVNEGTVFSKKTSKATSNDVVEMNHAYNFRVRI